jgi:BirA family biotin operon repressor/biotin-[acetyl-CoA-carboxylase] ligase
VGVSVAESLQPVVLSDGVQGKALGVGSDGALLVHTASGMKQVTSSEVSVRPLGMGA